jgi:hypothetical protein
VDQYELLQQLAEADLAVQEGERLLTQQRNVLTLLRSRKYDTRRTEKLLENLKRAQILLLSARQQIRVEVAKSRSGASRMH